MSAKKEFGDFQTPLPLAMEVIELVEFLVGRPERVVEPTAGLGTFLDAASGKWGKGLVYNGYEINTAYVRDANSKLSERGIVIEQKDFFETDWRSILSSVAQENVLVVGNPPWVTNAELGSLGSKNIPKKTNFQGLRGFDAKTGKANFDIAEWMLIRLIEALPSSGTLAMLCKTMTARKVLRHFWKANGGREQSSLFLIDAKKHFNVSVDACLFFIKGRVCTDKTAAIYATLSVHKKLSEFGLVDGNLISDISSYNELRDLDGGSPYTWRSGLKHDASDIMELTPENGHYVNGLDQTVDIEPDYVFPLLKSSDLGNGRTKPRRFVLVTQQSTGEDTKAIRDSAPKTWAYLEAHADKLDSRKSSIYQNRPRFSMFGIGVYSFAPWKVAISGLYNTLRFVVISPEAGRPVMLDDTCYSIACSSKYESCLIADLLNSDTSQRFLRSLVFLDSKRPITTDVLRRISLVSLAHRLGRLEDLTPYVEQSESYKNAGQIQLQLVMDKKKKYLIS
ncbi:MAG: hypothetical protein WCI11_02805 [Candidatus Methylumidiphilus sp.]